MLIERGKIELDDKTCRLLECDKCGACYVDEVGDKSECNVCNNHAYDMEDTSKDAKEYDKLLQKSNFGSGLIIGRSTLKDTTYWNIVSELYSIEQNSYGENREVPKKIVLQCKRCSAIKIVEREKLKTLDNVVCNTCRYALADKETQRSRIIWDSYVRRSNDIKAKTEKALELKRLAEEEKEHAATDGRDANYYNNKNKIKEINPNIRIVGKYRRDGIDTVQIACQACGTLQDFYAKGIKDLRKFKCSGCETRKTENSNYVGILKRNLVNTTINYMTVYKDLGNKVKLKCNCCSKNLTYEYDKIKFLNGEITHDCEHAIIDYQCVACYSPIDIPISIMKSKSEHISCPKCGTVIPKHLLSNEVVAMDKKIETRNALNVISGKINESVEMIRDIAKAKNPLYVSEDGNKYYNCRCLEHHQNMILNYGEIETYNHEKCNTKQNMFIGSEDILSLTFSKKRDT